MSYIVAVNLRNMKKVLIVHCVLYMEVFLHIVVTNHIRNATWGPIQCYYFCKGACDLYRLLLLD